MALKVFSYQAKYSPVYSEYTRHLGIDPNAVSKVEEIPFLPIAFFKQGDIITEGQEAEMVFLSSGTTGMIPSRHLVADLSWYENSFDHCFRNFYGDPADWVILALLPAYLEREGSSLIYMAEKLIEQSRAEQSGFYLYDFAKLAQVLQQTGEQGKKVLLLGVSFALLDFAEQYQLDLSHVTIMETGGMKGRRKEMVREELHAELRKAFGKEHIHSEYGMTELLSQAYSQEQGIFNTPPWMRILTRPTDDPLGILDNEKTGGINIIDLANINSCSFIATQDLGRVYEDHSFEILGRFDNSDVRGCNLLVVQ